ncbi:methyl-accepting chemotaxis protein [Methanospirillum lacunae]|uniref:Methyl-accepting chemotaxis protein n=1 Tax=Methanospirillum lacunae TaxID=668570 RepID=A0A2V2N1M7_9EURY|nr:methyl-accepting chemotaxis protein [Methanospirillum lacunae]PWR74234.1 hypothetical protein DK846_03530 [Methanospirillum lacunae]
MEQPEQLPDDSTFKIADLELFDALDLPAFTVDRSLTIRTINYPAAGFVGIPPEFCIGKNYREIFNLEDGKEGVDPTELVIKNNIPRAGEGIVRVKSESIPVKYGAKPISQQNGEVVGAVHYFIDQRQNEVLHEITHVLNDIREGNLDVRIDLTPYEGEVRGILEAVNTLIDTMSKPLIEVAFSLKELNEGKNPKKLSTERLGFYQKFAEIVNFTINFKGNNKTSSVDLTKNDSLEETLTGSSSNFSDLFDSLSIPVIMIDGQSNISYANQVAFTTVRKSSKELLGLPITLAFENTDSDIITNTLLKVISGDTPDGQVSLHLIGQDSPVSCVIDPIKSPSGSRIGAILTLLVGASGDIRVIEDLKRVMHEVEEGSLKAVISEQKYSGNSRVIVDTVNALIRSLSEPFTLFAITINQISAGKIPDRIPNQYSGELANITVDLNTTIDAIDLLISDGLLLTTAIEEGKLDVRTDASRHQGQFKAVIQGFNNTLDAVIQPLNITAEYLDRISKGDIPKIITDTAQGDFNKIRNNLNVCIDAINLLVSDGLSLTKAIEEGKLGTRSDTSKHFGEYRAVIQGFNNTLDAVVQPLNMTAEYMDRISKGDIPDKITDEYHGDFNEIKNNLNLCIDSINLLVSDGLLLTKAIDEGKLGTRSDTNKHFGEFRAVIQGFNNTLDAVVQPLNMTAEYMDRISKGDIPAKITDEYHGDFNEIKNNLNVCIDSINLLVSDGLLLTTAIEEGKLGTRADTTHHSGKFRAVIDGFNNTLDAVVKPLNISAEYVDRISKGDIPEKITNEYHGDFNEIKNNLNVCIDSINRLVSDGLLLTTAIEEGKLGTRADTTHHSGKFRAVIDGFNNTLDAVVKPLNMSAEYVDRISKGDIPEKITDEYYGDFNEIKNNLNVCIDSINRLVSDGLLLTKAMEEGKLGTRADTTHHFGEFRAVIDGFNNTIDAVVKPLNMSAEYMDRISKGDIPEKITDVYYGDFNEIKNNLNVCIDAINLLVSDGLLLTKAIEEGKLGTRSDTSKHFGEFRAVIQGFNNTIDAVVKPLNMSAEYMDRISKGDIPEKITDVYYGDFNEIKNNLNVCIDAINRLVSDGLLLTKAIEEGKLGTRSDTSKHFGEFRAVIQGFNNTLDAVVQPLNMTAEYMDRISKGDIPEKITDVYYGDFNEIKNNLNVCIDAINLLVSDGLLLTKAIEEGKLGTRSDTSKHFGEFRAVIQGFNNTIDAVVKPLNMSAEYMDRISKGDIPEKITDVYYGDFNEIKNNLNVCIEAINRLVSDGLLLTKAMEEGKLGTRADTIHHFGEFKAVIDGFNNTIDAVVKPLNMSAEYMDRISKGDIPEKITDVYYGDFNEIKNNLNVCIDAINLLVSDGLLLTKAIEEGKLGTRSDTSKHFGEFRAVIQGFNNTIDAVVKPLNMSAEYMDRISKGDIPEKITDVYYGDFNEIKNNLNVCIEAINRLVSDGLLLTKAMEEGKLGTRADTTHHFGEFRAVIDGFNNTIDAVVKPLNISAEYMDRISKGDIPEKITDVYYGDFNEIKNNLNVCIDAINLLVSDGLLLTKAIEEGKLGTRSDTSKHFGEFRAVIQGFNNTIDAVVKPLNMSAEYMDRISKGDIPEKITDVYYGDFNEIKNNLNVCIDAINRLVSDGLLLTKAIEEGKLGTRSDTSKHFGEFRAVIQGFNNTLDAVIKPLNITAEYMDRISKGDIPEKITDVYYGDFNEIKNNLNVCIDAINLLVSDGIVLSEAVDMGNLTKRTDISKHNGKFKELITGFNKTLDAVVVPFRVVNDQIIEIAASSEEATASIEEVASGSREVASNSEQVSLNAEKSNDALRQVLKTMEDLSVTVTQVSLKADSVSKIVYTANKLCEQGSGFAQKAEQGMIGITKSTDEVGVIVNGIKSKMDEIGKIVNLISDISSQTNLLALNAAIEAARAGDAGRGFAVVAAEVKSLAQESRRSAENIAEMISGLQQNSNAASTAMETADIEVKAGNEALGGTLEIFTKIVETVRDISMNIEEVASASEEQAASVEEITASINEVSSIVEETAKEAHKASDTTQETTAAIGQISHVVSGLSGVVETLSSEIKRFDI